MSAPTTIKISALPAAVGIDGVADYLPIVQSSVTNRINRNVFLGIASAPLGTTDAQSPTNKTFDNTNQVTLKDTKFTLQDDGDVTKQATFQLSSITAGQTRAVTIPDASLTMVGTATTQTLTNKTLTSPTITGGTYDNGTITVDSISGHTVGTTVTVGGVQMVNGVITTANSITNNGAIAAGAVIPNSLVANSGTGWTWTSFSPSWTNLTVGNGTNQGHYVQIGKTVFFMINFTLGSTSSVGTTPKFSLPVNCSTNYNVSAIQPPIGTGSCTAGGSNLLIFPCLATGNFCVLHTFTISTYPVDATLTASIPGVWATGNTLYVQGFYEVD